MSKLKLVAPEETNKEQSSPLDEELVDKLSEMLSEMLPESSDFEEFENAALELGNELVRRTLKKN